MKRTAWSAGLSVSGDGTGVVAHAGSAGLRLLADRTGLTGELSMALARRSFVPRHDRGRVLIDVAVMLADGGEAIADIDVLRHQSPLLGPVASAPTVWRTLDGLSTARLGRIDAARARVRRRVWSLLPTGCRRRGSPTPTSAMWWCWMWMPPSWWPTVRRSRRHQHSRAASGFIRSGCGATTPPNCWPPGCGPGNAGANTTADHLDVLAAAIAQIPRSHRKNLLIRADGAGASHGLLDWLTEQNQLRGRRVEYSIGFALTEALRQAIMLVPDKAWTPALDADGGVRDGGDVAELTGLLDLSRWPAGMRVIVRRERPHPGAQLSLFEEPDGWRYQAFVTNTATGQLAVPGSPPPCPRPRRGPHPPRQRHWPGPIPVARVRHQPRLAERRGDRRRPDRLAAAARPERRTCHRRTQSPALPATARPRPTDPQRPTPTPTDPGHLALGR